MTHVNSNTAYLKYGVSKSQTRLLTQNLFNIPEQYQDLYRQYYILYWKPDYFLQQLKDGIITRGNVTYQVIYHLCTPANLRKCKQAVLSFRLLQEEYEIEPYVLVKGVY